MALIFSIFLWPPEPLLQYPFLRAKMLQGWSLEGWGLGLADSMLLVLYLLCRSKNVRMKEALLE